jgi:hypothetical protein
VKALRVRVISKTKLELIICKKECKVECLSLSLHFNKGRVNMAKSRGISADIQSPRTRLLYLIYSAPNSRIKAAPGTKSSLSSALGYKSDGHFHYDWNYLIGSGMIEEKQGYYLVTETGKKEFALYSTAAMNNTIMVVMGIAMVFFTVGLDIGILPNESVAFFGAALISIGSLFLLISRRSKPKLPPNAKAILKELNRH